MAGGSELPTSTAQTTTATDLATSPMEVTRLFLSNISQAATVAIAQTRPWGEVFDRNAFHMPEDFSDALSRIRKNVSYFGTNYAVVLIVCVVLWLITNVGSLITLAVILAAWGYLYMVRRDPLVIYGRTFAEKEIFVILSILTIVGILLTGIGGTVITALLLGGLVVAVHGAFRVPDDLFLDDQEATGGFLSFLNAGGPAVVVSHV